MGIQPGVHQLRTGIWLAAAEAIDVLGHRPCVEQRDPRRNETHLDQVGEELSETLVGVLVVDRRLAVVDEKHPDPRPVRGARRRRRAEGGAQD
jgi:hypothetical protein